MRFSLVALRRFQLVKCQRLSVLRSAPNQTTKTESQSVPRQSVPTPAHSRSGPDLIDEGSGTERGCGIEEQWTGEVSRRPHGSTVLSTEGVCP